VFTDNGSKLVSAFDLESPGCVQRRTGLRFIHGRCAVHTANLVLNDAAKDVPDFKPFKSFVKAMINWLHLKPVKRALVSKGVTQKVPKAKWNSFTNAAVFMAEHADAFDAVQTEVSGSPVGSIEDYDEILKALKPFRVFIESVEGDQAMLASAYASLQRLYECWENMPSNEPARGLSAALHRRFETTADGVLMDLAFVLGKKGHGVYTAKIAAIDAFDPTTAEPVEAAAQKAFVDRFDAARDRFVDIARMMYPGEAETLGEEFDRCVTTADFWSSGHVMRLGWSLRRGDVKWRRFSNRLDGGFRHPPRELGIGPDPGVDDDLDVADVPPRGIRLRDDGSAMNDKVRLLLRGAGNLYVSRMRILQVRTPK
jgi:hypothetical protein